MRVSALYHLLIITLRHLREQSSRHTTLEGQSTAVLSCEPRSAGREHVIVAIATLADSCDYVFQVSKEITFTHRTKEERARMRVLH